METVGGMECGEDIEYVLEGGTNDGTYCFNTVQDIDPRSIAGKLKEVYRVGRLEVGCRFEILHDGYLHGYLIRDFIGYQDMFVKVVARAVGIERTEATAF